MKKKPVISKKETSDYTCGGTCRVCSRECERPTAWSGTLSYYASTWEAPTLEIRVSDLCFAQDRMRMRLNVMTLALCLMAVLILCIILWK